MPTASMGVAPELIDYQNYRFGRARQRYRGPKPDLDKPYVAFIGGSETYGKFVEKPYPALVGEALGLNVANWGTPEAGPGFFLKDPVLLEACSCAQVCVVSLMGAPNMSNRLYSVFQRRNARLKGVSKMLPLLFPEVNLTQYRFVHNMLFNIHKSNPENFKAVELELREAWIARMRELLEAIETTRVLVWMSVRAPEEDYGPKERGDFVVPPAFVNREMVEAVAPMADLMVEYVPAEALAKADGASEAPFFAGSGNDGMARYPGQAVHEQAAQLLAEPLQDILNITGKW